MNNSTIIIFGMSGDLARRQILPALYHLLRDQKLKNFVIIGAAIDDTTAEEILTDTRQFVDNVDEDVWQELVKRTYYQKLNFLYKEDYVALCERVEQLEKEYNLSGNRLFYLAAAAHHFCPITHHSAQSGLAQKLAEDASTWHRIVYEKPFGHDLASAHEVNACIAKWLNEDQIYRIDHFLTKEIVSNISLIRFTNSVFEPLWNNRYIDHVQIVLGEQVCMEGRGAYYDAYGALRDVVQNHMLELLALIAMEPPEKLTGDFIRKERAKVLEHVAVVDGMLGQYHGYTKEKDVKPDSKTDTFAVLYLTVDNHRWSGVPFYLKTGKCLDKKETVIHIKFKQVDCLLVRNCPTPSNWLTIKVTPDATFSLQLNAKKPDVSDEIVSVAMEFCHSCVFGPRTSAEAYETLLEEVMRGEQSVSVRFDEIESAWRIIDTVRAKDYPLYTYEVGTSGPKEIERFEKKHGMRWRS